MVIVMKLILYQWGSNSDNQLKNKLAELDHSVVVYEHKCEHYTKDVKLANGLINLIHEHNAEAVISYDFFPIISMVCNTVGIPYYSWVYDSPHYTLLAKTAGYTCNHIGCFDRALVDRLNASGVTTVKHLPLGVEWPEISEDESKKYACDVSFVGSLYTGKYDYYDNMHAESRFIHRAEECIKNQCFDYENDYISGFFRDGNNTLALDILATARNMLNDQALLPGDDYYEDIEYIFSSAFLEKKVTVEERKKLLNKVAEMDCDFRLYTGSDLSVEPVLKRISRGYIDYHTAMPKVFRASRINLNITLRSIKTGIPLRALDIMACGGFLLSNYQQELAEYFEEDKELVMFKSLEECTEKISYYLAHEDERRKIAEAGQEAVRERFNIRTKLEELFDLQNK